MSLFFLKIHNDSSTALLSNDKVFLFTPQCQVIAKIIMHNIIPKSGEFDRARGCISLLIFCVLESLPVNLPSMIFDQMTFLTISAKSLPFGKLLTLLFQFWGTDLSKEDLIPPPAPLNRDFLNRKQSSC